MKIEPKQPKKIGRPTLYSLELANVICEQMTLGRSLKKICEDSGMPCIASVFKWLSENKEFSDKYAYACGERSEAMLEDIIDLSDGAIAVIKAGAEKKSGALAQAVRLQVDTRKWYMSKMKPKKYGDKLDVTSDGKPLPAPIYNGLSTNATHPTDK